MGTKNPDIFHSYKSSDQNVEEARKAEDIGNRGACLSRAPARYPLGNKTE